MMRTAALFACVALVGACARTELASERRVADEDIGDGDADGGDSVDDTPLVLFGQTTSTNNSNLERGMELPAGVAVCNGRLVVADQFDTRVLIWNSLPASGPPSLVLGQPDFTTRVGNYAGVDARGLFAPIGVACTNETLAVVDNGNSRVMIWRPFPTTSFEAATVVVGQPDFSTRSAGVDAATLSGPQGVAIVGNALFVADTDNNRVMVWNSIPTVSGTNASYVLGQADFNSAAADAGGALGAIGFRTPTAIASDGTRFVVADTGNNRVLVWNTTPGFGVPPNFVLGQADFTSGGAPMPATDASLNQPRGVGFAGSTLFVADTDSDRVQVFNSAITTNNQAANTSFGQSAHVGQLLPVYSAATLEAPRGIAVAGSDLYVADSQAHRVLLYGVAAPISSAKAALGQPNTDSGAKRCPPQGVDGAALGLPMDVVVNGNQLLVVDFIYHRVLGWNSIPTTAGTPADFVLGQPTLTAYDARDIRGGPSAFQFPTAALVVNGNLHVVDRDNNRIMVWDGVPTANVPAARVLGQPDFASLGTHAPMDGASFRQPSMLASDGTRFAIADQSNNRVLVWNSVPTDANRPADVILGQTDPSVFTENTGGRSASSLSTCRGVTLTPNGVAVADTGNLRVLIWNNMPTSNAAPADVVLGQVDKIHADGFAASRTSVGEPTFVHYSDGLLFVSSAHRILVWRGVPTVDNAPADYVIGQASFTGNLANAGGLTIDTVQSPYGVRVAGDDMYIADVENDRIIRKPLPAP